MESVILFDMSYFYRKHFTAKKVQNVTNVNLRSLALFFCFSFDHKYEVISLYDGIVKRSIKSFLKNDILEF